VKITLIIAELYTRCAIHGSSADFIARQHSNADSRYLYRNSVCPSVRLSVTLRYCIETAEHVIILSSAYGRPIILVFPALKSFAKFWRGQGVEYRWGI